MKNKIILILFFPFIVLSKNIAVTQTGYGNQDGVDSANSHSIAWLNTADNWGTDEGDFIPGDTVTFYDTISTALTIRASGTVDDWYVLRCGSFIAPAWGENGAIYINNKQYILLDSITIKCSDNGEGLGESEVTYGVYVIGVNSNNLIMSKLTINSIFLRPYNGTSNTKAIGIRVSDASDVTIDDCTIKNAYYGLFIFVNTDGINQNNINIVNSHIDSCSTCIGIAQNTGITATTSNVVISEGLWIMGKNWYDDANLNHVDGLHVWTGDTATTTIENFTVNNLHIKGDPGTHSTSPLYFEIVSPKVYVYNNIIESMRSSWGCMGFKIKKSDPCTLHVYNNTLLSCDSARTQGIYMQPAYSGSVFYIKNNIINSTSVSITDANLRSEIHSDYNVFHDCNSIGKLASTYYYTLETWSAAIIGEEHSYNTSPLLDGLFSPTAGSVCINNGYNFSDIFDFDFYNRSRGQLWDIGAVDNVDGKYNKIRIKLK